MNRRYISDREPITDVLYKYLRHKTNGDMSIAKHAGYIDANDRLTEKAFNELKGVAKRYVATTRRHIKTNALAGLFKS